MPAKTFILLLQPALFFTLSIEITKQFEDIHCLVSLWRVYSMTDVRKAPSALAREVAGLLPRVAKWKDPARWDNY